MLKAATIWDAISLLAGGKVPRTPRTNHWTEKRQPDKRHTLQVQAIKPQHSHRRTRF